MLLNRQLFLQHVAQTSDNPLLLEIIRAEGVYLYDINGKAYIDLISGVSVSNVGHSNPNVVNAIKQQAENYLHLMVYGEYVESPQVGYAKLLADCLPPSLDNVYFVNSGSEANEGAMKLAKRYTGRSEIIAFRNAYHGSTHGALSIMGNEYYKGAFRPLLPGVTFLEFNSVPDLDQISLHTACVIIEPIQGEAGVIVADKNYMAALREKCNQTGTLLIFDEIQTGFGRTGSLFAFEQFDVIPDIITLAKALGGGMPLGAFIASQKIMSVFKDNPILGHITTFGGHPVCCAAGLAALQFILDNKLTDGVKQKEDLFRKNLNHPAIKDIRGIGLLLAVQLDNFEQVKKVIKYCIENGTTGDWFLFCDNSFRIAPPLIINETEILKCCEIINKAIDVSIQQ
jgi:acetylornithine/N-succinyldiaminopimelate aminotransferase